MENINFYGLKLTRFYNHELIREAIVTIKSKKTKIYYGYSLTIIPMFGKYPDLYYYSNSSDVIVCDGAILYYFVNLLGFKLKSNISIPEMVRLLINLANQNAYSIYLLGATDEINKCACKEVRNKNSNLSIYGRSGYFYENEIDNVIADVKLKTPNIILIGMTSPQKEKIANKMKYNNCGNIIIPCGGMIDVLAGKTKQTPKLIKRLGFATLFRLFQEPKRLYRRYFKAFYHILFKIIPNILWAKITVNKTFKIPKIYKNK